MKFCFLLFAMICAEKHMTDLVDDNFDQTIMEFIENPDKVKPLLVAMV